MVNMGATLSFRFAGPRCILNIGDSRGHLKEAPGARKEVRGSRVIFMGTICSPQILVSKPNDLEESKGI